jgi:hypothetical protein
MYGLYVCSLSGWMVELLKLLSHIHSQVHLIQRPARSFEPETALPLEGGGVVEEIIPLDREYQETVTT